MQQWFEALDNQIIALRRNVLEGNGSISHEEAIKKQSRNLPSIVSVKCVYLNQILTKQLSN